MKWNEMKWQSCARPSLWPENSAYISFKIADRRTETSQISSHIKQTCCPVYCEQRRHKNKPMVWPATVSHSSKQSPTRMFITLARVHIPSSWNLTCLTPRYTKQDLSGSTGTMKTKALLEDMAWPNLLILRHPECKTFLFSTAYKPALGPIQPPLQWVPGALSARVSGRAEKLSIHLYPMRRSIMAGPYFH
jgi:hypothetical protein